MATGQCKYIYMNIDRQQQSTSNCKSEANIFIEFEGRPPTGTIYGIKSQVAGLRYISIRTGTAVLVDQPFK